MDVSLLDWDWSAAARVGAWLMVTTNICRRHRVFPHALGASELVTAY